MSVKSSNHFLFITRQAPYGSYKAQQCLDVALAAAVYEQQVSYVFIDDGVFQLVANQQPKDIQSKSISAALETVELYGIDQIYVDEESLSARGFVQSDLVIEAKVITSQELCKLTSESDHVITL